MGALLYLVLLSRYRPGAQFPNFGGCALFKLRRKLPKASEWRPLLYNHVLLGWLLPEAIFPI